MGGGVGQKYASPCFWSVSVREGQEKHGDLPKSKTYCFFCPYPGSIGSGKNRGDMLGSGSKMRGPGGLTEGGTQS